VLVEPVIFSSMTHMLAHIPGGKIFTNPTGPLIKGAQKRADTFSSLEEATERFTGRGAFATWRKPFLDDYLADGVFPMEGETFKLACSPSWEAANFGAYKARPWGAVHALRKHRYPVIVLQAERNSTAPRDLDERIHSVRPDAAVTRVPGTTHFLPMERPYVVRDAVKVLIETANGLKDGTDYLRAVKRTINDSIGQIF